MALVAAVAAVISYSAVSGRRLRAPEQPLRAVPVLTSPARVPSSLYQTLSVAGGRILLSGGPGGGPLAESTFGPSESAGGIGATASTGQARSRSSGAGGAASCHSALVSTANSRLLRQMTGPCEDPGLFYQRVLPVVKAVPGVVDGSTLRLSRVLGNGRFVVSPVLTRWTDVSGAALETSYGGGYLWIYVPLSANGGELFGVSQATALVERVKVPEVASPLLSAGEGGLWFAGRASLAPPFQPGVYYVAQSGGGAKLIVKAPGATWLVSSGTRAWLGTRTDVYELTRTKVAREVRRGFGGPAFAAGPDGLVWALSGQRCALAISQLDLATGPASELASLPAQPRCSGQPGNPALAWAGGYLWVLAGSADSRFSYLYRVKLPS